MTSKEKIIELMKYKLWKSQIDRPDCPDYYVKADFDDVRSWSNCEEVWEKIEAGKTALEILTFRDLNTGG